MKDLVLIYGTGSEANELFMESANSMDLNPRIHVVPWRDVANFGAFGNTIHYLNKPSTAVRLLNPWEDNFMNENYFTAKGESFKDSQKFEKLMGNVRRMFSDAYFPISPESAVELRSKDAIADKLNSNGIRHPQTFHINNQRDLDSLMREYGTLFMKPDGGSQGEGTGIIGSKHGRLAIRSNYETEDHQCYYDDNAKNLMAKIFDNGDSMVFQEYVKMPVIDGQIFDMRVLTIGNNAEFSYARASPRGSVSTNISLGAKPRLDILNSIPEKQYGEALEMAEETSRAFDMDYSGVDIIFGENFKPYVLEANAFPGVEGPTHFGFNPFQVELSQYELRPESPTPISAQAKPKDLFVANF